MRTIISILVLFITAGFWSCNGQQQNNKVLIFSKTEGYRHASIPDGIEAFRKLGRENGFSVDTTEDSNLFNADNLGQYDAIIFLSTTGDVLNEEQQMAFEQYIKAGGGYMGVHAAADTEYEWAWYGKLVGGYFQSHPPGTPTAVVDVVDKGHPATSFLPDRWERTDEWYNYYNINPDLHVLATLDESTYEGGENPDFHPTAWYHEFDGGRAFYTGGGHTSEAYTEELFVKHLWGGLQWVLELND